MANVDYDQDVYESAIERGKKVRELLGPEAYARNYAHFDEWIARGRMVKKGMRHVHRREDGLCMFSVDQTENRKLSQPARTLADMPTELSEVALRRLHERKEAEKRKEAEADFVRTQRQQVTPAPACEKVAMDPSAMRDMKALERKVVDQVMKRPKTKKAPRFWATTVAPMPTPGVVPTLWGA